MTFGYGVDGTQPYPFSVKPDTLLSAEDIMRINRDQFEGTAFDMTTGMDAGQFGDPTRFFFLSKDVNVQQGISMQQYRSALGSERPISLFRTVYSTISQGRAWLPDSIGAGNIFYCMYFVIYCLPPLSKYLLVSISVLRLL